MSIAPPSDLVLDVAKAADPQKLRAATAKLAQLGSGAAGDSFGAQLAAVGTAPPKTATAVAPFPTANTTVTAHKGGAYEKFEAMMLQNFIGEILPKDSDLFGDATSADAYRSMFADQLATQLAKSGKIGIAHAIEVSQKGANLAAQMQSAIVPATPGLASALTALRRPT